MTHCPFKKVAILPRGLGAMSLGTLATFRDDARAAG